MESILRAFFWLALALLFPMLTATAGEKQAGAPPVSGLCTLQHKEFCGVWKPYSNRDGAGRLTITGSHLSWQNGDTADCTPVQEGERAGMPFTLLNCLKHYHGEDDNPQTISYLVHPHSSPNGIFLAFDDRPECLLGAWELMHRDGGFRILDSAPGCSISTIPYGRDRASG